MLARTFDPTESEDEDSENDRDDNEHDSRDEEVSEQDPFEPPAKKIGPSEVRDLLSKLFVGSI